MKKINYLSVLISSVSLALVSCMNTNAPELDSTNYSAVATEAFATSVSETAIYETEATVKSAIVNETVQSIGAQKVIVIGTDNAEVSNDSKKSEDSKDSKDLDVKENAYPKVSLVSKKNAYPKEYVIDYGKEGYTNKNNVKFRGQIYYTVSDISSKKKEYKFAEFYINDSRVEGRRTVELVEKGVLRIISEEKSQLENGKTTYRYSERTRTKIDSKEVKVEGDGDGDADEDDVKGLQNSYSFVISTKGVNAKGVEYTVETKEPVVSVYNKKSFVKGVIVITTNKGSKNIDYSKENNANSYSNSNNNSDSKSNSNSENKN